MFRNEGVIVIHVQLGALALPRLLPHGDLDRDQVVSHHVVLRRLQQQRRLFVDVGATAGVRNARNGRRFRDGRFPREILYVGEDVGTCGIEQKRGRLLKGFQVPATISAKELAGKARSCLTLVHRRATTQRGRRAVNLARVGRSTVLGAVHRFGLLREGQLVAQRAEDVARFLLQLADAFRGAGAKLAGVALLRSGRERRGNGRRFGLLPGAIQAVVGHRRGLQEGVVLRGRARERERERFHARDPREETTEGGRCISTGQEHMLCIMCEQKYEKVLKGMKGINMTELS